MNRPTDAEIECIGELAEKIDSSLREADCPADPRLALAILDGRMREVSQELRIFHERYSSRYTI